MEGSELVLTEARAAVGPPCLEMTELERTSSCLLPACPPEEVISVFSHDSWRKASLFLENI